MARLEDLTFDELNPEQRSVIEAINAGPRGGGGRVGLIGPYGVWVRAPKVGMAIQALGGAARFDTSLPEAVKEIGICVVGAKHKAKFEFAAHARLAARAGIDADAIEAIRTGDQPRLEGDQAVAHSVARQLMEDHRLKEETYREAVALWGESGIIELVSIIGYYVLVSLTLNAFEVPLVDGMSDPFPEIDA